MTEKNDDEEVTIRLPQSLLKQIDRIAKEMELTRQKIIQDVLWDRFTNQEGWLDDLLQ